MPKKVLVRTAVPGETASDRKLLADITDISEAPAPSEKSDGILLSRNEYIHLLFEVSGSATPNFYVQMWWYSPISGLWHQGELLSINANDINTFEVQGLDRLALEVTSITGPDTPTLSAWVGLVVPV